MFTLFPRGRSPINIEILPDRLKPRDLNNVSIYPKCTASPVAEASPTPVTLKFAIGRLESAVFLK